MSNLAWINAASGSTPEAPQLPIYHPDGSFEATELTWNGQRSSAGDILEVTQALGKSLPEDERNFPLGFYFATGPVGEGSLLIQLVASQALLGMGVDQANWQLTLPRNDNLAVTDTTSRFPQRNRNTFGCRRYGIHVERTNSGIDTVAVTRVDEGLNSQQRERRISEREGARVAHIAARICVKNITEYLDKQSKILQVKHDIIAEQEQKALPDKKKIDAAKQLHYPGVSKYLPESELILPEAEITAQAA